MILLMAEILHQLIGSFSHYYRVSYIPGGAKFQPSTVPCLVWGSSWFLSWRNNSCIKCSPTLVPKSPSFCWESQGGFLVWNLTMRTLNRDSNIQSFVYESESVSGWCIFSAIPRFKVPISKHIHTIQEYDLILIDIDSSEMTSANKLGGQSNIGIGIHQLLRRVCNANICELQRKFWYLISWQAGLEASLHSFQQVLDLAMATTKSPISVRDAKRKASASFSSRVHFSQESPFGIESLISLIVIIARKPINFDMIQSWKSSILAFTEVTLSRQKSFPALPPYHQTSASSKAPW